MEREKDLASPAAAASALIWWADAGADALVDEEPRNWLRPKAKAINPAAISSISPLAPADIFPDQLDLFHAWLQSEQSLCFAAPSAPRIGPSGDPASGLMIMLDMPAIEDCEAGILLSGAAGSLFDRMLAAIGRGRNSIYLASLSTIRSPTGGFDAETVARCAAVAHHHIGLVSPKALLLFGDACGKALLGQSVMQGRGRWHELSTDAGPIPTILTFHPNSLLEQSSFKAAAWADLQILMERLG
jgi:DNA polymerase